MATTIKIPDKLGNAVGREVLALLNSIVERITQVSGIGWNQINFTGSSHDDIESIGEVDPASSNTTRNKHVSNNDLKVLYDRKSVATADIATADATDAASAIVLANANKAKINQLLANLRSAGLMNT